MSQAPVPPSRLKVMRGCLRCGRYPRGQSSWAEGLCTDCRARGDSWASDELGYLDKELRRRRLEDRARQADRRQGVLYRDAAGNPWPPRKTA